MSEETVHEAQFGWIADNAAILTPVVVTAGAMATEAFKAKLTEKREVKNENNKSS